ncbi:MAG TPA: hypothetical protein VLV78_21630 [Thermoanaerobaculia bacterium]|nr:hypothetical protein [Thermoanaerobaculia bacterium]
MRLVVRTVLATLFVAIGIAGLVLPILPGWLFFGFAAMILFPDAKFTQKTTAWLHRRFPWTQHVFRTVVR